MTDLDPPRRPLPDEQGFLRTHVGTYFAVLLRVHPAHEAAARQAIAERMGVPVGVIEVRWAWLQPVAGKVANIRRAA